MGNETVCAVDLDGVKSEAKVLLETDELIVRAPYRVRVPFSSITTIDADDKRLRLSWPSHALSIFIGTDAKKWAARIRNPKPLTEKLGVKSGQRISISGKLAKKFIDELHALGTDTAARLRRDSEIIFLTIERRKELDRVGGMLRFLTPDGALWVIRPKGSSAISEREVMDAARSAGLVDVKVARFSETHTAEKFVIRAKDRENHRKTRVGNRAKKSLLT